MKPSGPRLDRHGFPIPPDFNEAGVSDPGQGGRSNFGWVRGLLKLAVVACVLGAVWVHFDLGTKLAKILGQYHAQQAYILLEKNEWQDALRQIDLALEWSPHENDFLNMRTNLLFLLQRHREAADAATEMLQRNVGNRAENLNSRAYSRAVGGFDLDEALADIDEALGQIGGDNAMFLDTRAYILFKLGRTDDALTDVDKAITRVEKERDEWEQQARSRVRNKVDAAMLNRQSKAYDHHLAVMYYHRGEIHEKLGNDAQAKKDLFIGKQLGYDPAAGVY